MFIEHYNEQSFNWLSWRYGDLTSTLNIPCREYAIISNKHILRKHAIGWCKADNIPCRPKKNCVAVMFNTGELENFWTHLTEKEFKICFPELKKYF